MTLEPPRATRGLARSPRLARAERGAASTIVAALSPTFACAVVVGHLVACSSSAPPQDAPAPTSAKPATTGSSSASAPASALASATTASTGEPAPATSAVASAAPSASPSSQPAPPAPLPEVEITNIGMHIGGGPNDAPTKEPIKLSVAPHFDSFRRCFVKVDDAGQAKGGDVSADLFVPRAGGKVTVKKVTTSLSGEGFKDCVKGAFEAIDFRKPKGGDTVVSYSLRFKPAKKK